MPLIIPANSAVSGGFDVDNSCRFNDGSSDYLRWNDSPSGNRQKFTWSIWFKRGVLGTTQTLGAASYSSGDEGYFEINSSDQFEWDSTEGNNGNLITNRRFRDISAWSNVVVAVDTTQGTAANRMKVYVNGVQETSFATETYPDQNSSLYWNVGGTYYPYIGRKHGGEYFDGYIAEVVNIDNQQLAEDSFGEFDDSGIWKPIDVSGLTFGTAGYYLDFEDSSELGKDVSGVGNSFVSANLAAIDQSTDTCTNNFATWNPLVHYSSSATFSEGNLKVAPTENTSRVYTVSTIAMPTVSGSKWYAEFKYLETNDVALIGILDAKQISYVFRGNSDLDNENSDTSVGRVTYRGGNGKIKYPSGQSVDTNVTLSNNDIVMIALDAGSGKIWFGVNGTWVNSGNPANGSNGVDFTGQGWWTSGVDDFVFLVGDGNTGGHDDWEANFGSPPYAISSGNADGDGYGNFEYAVPSGYFALNTKNLAEYG